MMLKLVLFVGALMGASAFASSTSFDQFAPLKVDVGAGTLPEAAPFALSSPRFSQMTIVARDPTQAKRF